MTNADSEAYTQKCNISVRWSTPYCYVHKDEATVCKTREKAMHDELHKQIINVWVVNVVNPANELGANIDVEKEKEQYLKNWCKFCTEETP